VIPTVIGNLGEHTLPNRVSCRCDVSCSLHRRGSVILKSQPWVVVTVDFRSLAAYMLNGPLEQRYQSWPSRAHCYLVGQLKLLAPLSKNITNSTVRPLLVAFDLCSMLVICSTALKVYGELLLLHVLPDTYVSLVLL
jgi:hypothetical protein